MLGQLMVQELTFFQQLSLQRFCLLLRSTRFDDIHTRAERRLEDKFAASTKFIKRFVDNCISNYNVSQYATVDKILAASRRHCSFRVYMPSKPAKYGLKVFILEVYLGKQPEGSFAEDNSGASKAKRLVSHIHGSGRNIATDNWYTSYGIVVDFLKNYKLTLVGTLRKNNAKLSLSMLLQQTELNAQACLVFRKMVH